MAVSKQREPVTPATAATPTRLTRLTRPGGEEQGSTATALASAAIGTLTLGWFGVSRWALGSPVVDAAGEAAGGVMTLLLLVSVVGSVRRSRR
jgi:hypothetical protein